MWPKIRFTIPRKSNSRVKVPEARFPPIDPRCESAETIAVIGDVHGMSRAFETLIERLSHEAPEAKLICVGDLIDRGEESAAVLRQAFDLRENLLVLLGNHEEMLLNFLDNPVEQGPRWLRYGGLQCLASFSIGGLNDRSEPARLLRARDDLRAALGEDLEHWLRSRPRQWQSGNVAVVHAGVDPWSPMSQQSDRTLTWGHADFGHRPRRDGIWVVHGHTIVDGPVYADGIISVDTGAYAGGGLTAALISAGSVHFVTIPS